MMFCFSMYFIYRLRIIKQLEVNNSSFYTSIENSFCINMVCLSIKHLAFDNLDMYTSRYTRPMDYSVTFFP